MDAPFRLKSYTTSELPDPADFAGGTAYDTTRSALVISNGSSWSPVGQGGTYTPTATPLVNIDSVSTFECQYMRVGSVVTVSGRVDFDPSASGVAIRFSLTLPVAATFTSASQASGVCTSDSSGTAQQTVSISASGSTVYFEGRSTVSTSVPHFFTFTYRIPGA